MLTSFNFEENNVRSFIFTPSIRLHVVIRRICFILRYGKKITGI